MSTRLPTLHEPMRDIAALRDGLDRMFRTSLDWGREPVEANGWSPELDIEETDEGYVLHVEMPGVKIADISVDLDEDVLSIDGKREFYEEKETESFRRIERRFGSFHRAVRLPGKVDADSVQADYQDGLLTVTVPKAAEARPHRIEVTSR
jgi:HSP20 family protein